MPPTLRPLSLGELLDRTFQLYRNHFLLFVGITFVAYLPKFMIECGLLLVPKQATGATIFGTLLNLVLSMAAVAAAQAATVTAVSAVYLDQRITVRESYSRIMGMIPRVVLVMIGMGIGIGIGILLVIVPGIIFALMWALTIPIVVLEHADLGEALSRSRELTSGHRLRVLMIFVLFTVLTYLVFLVLESPIIAIIVAKGAKAALGGAMSIATYTLSLISECLVTPLMTIALSLMYYDERVRKEAFDIQLMMGGLEGQTQSVAPSVS